MTFPFCIPSWLCYYVWHVFGLLFGLRDGGAGGCGGCGELARRGGGGEGVLEAQVFPEATYRIDMTNWT